MTFENVTIVSTGTIDNSGLIDPGAVYQPFHPGNLFNYGTINNNNDGQIYWIHGILTNYIGSTINNHGSVNFAGNSIANSGTINNYNLIYVQDGFFKNLVHGIINNNGTFWNDFTGITINKFGASINNYGTINNTAFAVSNANFTNLGSITNGGSIFNQLRCPPHVGHIMWSLATLVKLLTLVRLSILEQSTSIVLAQ